MRRTLLDILACPMCKSPLTLTVKEENDVEIVQGNMHCENCKEDYPIDDSIPNLLPPNLRS
jgi:uncharacterized protein YbaR (Trm112 family)